MAISLPRHVFILQLILGDPVITSHKGFVPFPPPRLLPFDIYRDWVQHSHTSPTIVEFCMLALLRFLQVHEGNIFRRTVVEVN